MKVCVLDSSIDDFLCRVVLHGSFLVGDGCRTPELRHGETDGTGTTLGEFRSKTIKVPLKDDLGYRGGYKPRRQGTRAGAIGDGHDG